MPHYFHCISHESDSFAHSFKVFVHCFIKGLPKWHNIIYIETRTKFIASQNGDLKYIFTVVISISLSCNESLIDNYQIRMIYGFMKMMYGSLNEIYGFFNEIYGFFNEIYGITFMELVENIYLIKLIRVNAILDCKDYKMMYWITNDVRIE